MTPQKLSESRCPPLFETLENRLLMSNGALIVTSDALVPAFDEVAEWYTRKGYPAEIITTSDIYGRYPGRDNQEQIRNCITDYYENHGVGYVLLGGDNSVVPDRDTYVRVSWYNESSMPTDLYYASLSGQWDSDGDNVFGEAGQDTDVALSYDVVVARYPVRTAQHVQDLFEKVLAYEMSPAQENWATNMLAAGTELWSTRDAGTYNDITFDHAASDAEVKSLTADAQYVLPYWSERELDVFFDTASSWDGATAGDYDLTRDNLSAALSNDYQFVHVGTHGNSNGWALERGGYSSSMVAGLTESFNAAIVSTMACSTGAFDRAEASLSEAFLRSPDTGTVVYLGSSRYGWGYYGALLGPSIRYSYQFYEEFLGNGQTLAGDAFAASKEFFASMSDSNSAYRWVQFGLNFQGDPLVQMYRNDPAGLSPTYDATIFSGSQEFVVAGLPAGSRVCLWQGENVYQVGQADAAGVFRADVSPELGTMKLTVVAQDAAVYTDELVVQAQPPTATPVDIPAETPAEVNEPDDDVSSIDTSSDSQADVIWPNETSGGVELFSMERTAPVEWAEFDRVPQVDGEIAGVGEFDGDGGADALWGDETTGLTGALLTDGSRPTPWARNASNENRRLSGMGDSDGNGNVDILSASSTTGPIGALLTDATELDTGEAVDTIAA